MYEFMRENEGLIKRIKKWKESGIYMSNIVMYIICLRIPLYYEEIIFLFECASNDTYIVRLRENSEITKDIRQERGATELPSLSNNVARVSCANSI